MNWKYCLSVPPGFTEEELRDFMKGRLGVSPVFLEPAKKRILVGGSTNEMAIEEAQDLWRAMSLRGIVSRLTAYALPRCPFCGGENTETGAYPVPRINQGFYVTFCRDCGAGGPNKPTAEAAEAAWERRAQ